MLYCIGTESNYTVEKSGWLQSSHSLFLKTETRAIQPVEK